MGNLTALDPSPLWSYFEEICKIPRLSKNEKLIREYLLSFAAKNNLQAKEDETGNIVIIREASKGMEHRSTIVLQSHMDMVGEKNADHKHNWHKDPIIPRIKDGWVVADGTTLGADDGIGMAAQLALLVDDSIKTGKMECLFTVDEETGMTGAFGLKKDFFDGRTLINLDSEDEGILFIGCAGGIDTVGTIKCARNPSPAKSAAYKISVRGLRGGHSGDEIHKGFGNSVKLMARLLLLISEKADISLSYLKGGNLRNAIPREAFATVAISESQKKILVDIITLYESTVKKEFGALEKDLTISCSETDLPDSILDTVTQKNLLHALNCCPHGVIAWSKDMADLVETSTNLASVETIDDNTIKIVTTQRSSVESSKHYAKGMVASCLILSGATVEHSEGYPGWKPDVNSPVLRITTGSYRKLFGTDPVIKAIHAGLECGLFFEKFPGIDMISFGPTIRGAHTPQEMIEIKTVRMFWDLLSDVLVSIP